MNKTLSLISEHLV